MTRLLDAADFRSAAAPPPLAAGEMHLWFFPQWENVPSAAQSPRIRGMLARYLGRSAADLHFARDAHGKPYVDDADLSFNLSHSAAALLLGVGRHCRLGVDLEHAQRKTRSVTELAQRWFSAGEARALAAFPEAQQQYQFLRLWTAKEALVKAQGLGVGEGLRAATFLPSADFWICADHAWQVLPLTPGPGWIGALAWTGSVSRVSAFVAPAIAPGE